MPIPARTACRVRLVSSDFITGCRRSGAWRPADLAKLGAIVPSYVTLEGLALKGPAGHQAPLRLQPVMKSDDTNLTLHAVRAGIGMSFLPEWLVDDDLAQGRLVRLVPEYAAPPVTLFAVYTSRQYMAPKLRSFIDFLGEQLGGRQPAPP